MTVSYNRLFKREKIKEEIKLIDGSSTCYVSETGKVYKNEKDDLFFEKKLYTNKRNGYVYCGILYDESTVCVNRRVHILVAKAFIPLIEGKEIVGHIDNIKQHNHKENLEWCTSSENSQKAHDDGLIKNKKSFEDNQSKEVYMYDLDWNLIGHFGSQRECVRETEAKLSTISRQCLEGSKSPKPRKGFRYRRYKVHKLKKIKKKNLTKILVL